MTVRLLDLFCGEGGAAVGYNRAGFTVTGVDLNPKVKPYFPFEFICGDALEYLKTNGTEYDIIHASPPCQGYTNASNRWRGKGTKADTHLRQIKEVRELLNASGKPWVIENVPGSRRYMCNPITLTGGMFKLKVHRPRLFETSYPIRLRSPAPQKVQGECIGVYGVLDGRRLSNCSTRQRAARNLFEARHCMGMPWASPRGLAEAIPPAYTEYIGQQLMEYLKNVK